MTRSRRSDFRPCGVTVYQGRDFRSQLAAAQNVSNLQNFRSSPAIAGMTGSHHQSLPCAIPEIGIGMELAASSRKRIFVARNSACRKATAWSRCRDWRPDFIGAYLWPRSRVTVYQDANFRAQS